MALLSPNISNQFFSLGISRPESINFFTHRMVLKSDQGTEFINHDVKNLCVELGCAQEFSCPGDSGKWQNGVVERRIKELGTTARKLMHTSQMLPEAKMHALYHAADILNALPTTGNPGGSDSTGLPPQYVFDGSGLDLDTPQPFTYTLHPISGPPAIVSLPTIIRCRDPFGPKPQICGQPDKLSTHVSLLACAVAGWVGRGWCGCWVVGLINPDPSP